MKLTSVHSNYYVICIKNIKKIGFAQRRGDGGIQFLAKSRVIAKDVKNLYLLLLCLLREYE